MNHVISLIKKVHGSSMSGRQVHNKHVECVDSECTQDM